MHADNNTITSTCTGICNNDNGSVNYEKKESKT